MSLGYTSTEPTVTDRLVAILPSVVRLPNQISSVFDALSFSRGDAHQATSVHLEILVKNIGHGVMTNSFDAHYLENGLR